MLYRFIFFFSKIGPEVQATLIAQQGNKCMFKILKLCNDNLLHVFDTYVASVRNYVAEVWGFHPGNDIEKFHTRLCKIISRLKQYS